MQLRSLHNIMVTPHQILKSISHSGPLCPLAETVLSLFAPNKQPVIISLAVKLNHIPGKGNVAVLFLFLFLFLSGRGECIFENPNTQLLLAA